MIVAGGRIRKERRIIWASHPPATPQKRGGRLLKGQCSFIKPNGERCRGIATGQNGFCWAHDPANAEERRRTASRAGRAKGNKEVAALKEEIKDLITDMKAGDLDRNDAAVMIQGYRALKDFIALERQVRETDQLAAEIEELKREYGVAG
jgi:hypothetical protein